MLNARARQAGFTVIGIIGVVVVVLAIVGAGFVVFKKTKNTQAPATQQEPAPPVRPKADKSGNTVAAASGPAQLHSLEIKEWGVSIPLPAEAQDAYYTTVGGGGTDPIDGATGTAWISFKSLDGTSCDVAKTGPTETKNPIGWIGRALPDDHEPVIGKKYTELYPDGTMIDGHYYFYAPWATRNCAPEAKLKSLDLLLKASVPKTTKVKATN